ncbi:N-acetyltransferase [Kiritimatiellota bacterium B12222]|nr:N-acetyltransferase [Kiritimatiellota bacterium B12222]
MQIHIRAEKPPDEDAIDELLDLAFAFDSHSQQNEAHIVRVLREQGQLTLSLVAQTEQNELVGHICFSPVQIDTGNTENLSGWLGLGPMAVNPRLQRQGIGRQLIQVGLAEIQRHATGCVVLGEPGFYQRFGFKNHPDLILPGALAPFFMAQSFSGDVPSGQVIYQTAFQTT